MGLQFSWTALIVFKVHKSKEGTGRVVFWREFKILQSFTMESSLGGGEMISGRMEHFNTRHFKVSLFSNGSCPCGAIVRSCLCAVS